MYILNNIYLELNIRIILIENLLIKILRFNFSTLFISFFILPFTACVDQIFECFTNIQKEFI